MPLPLKVFSHSGDRAPYKNHKQTAQAFSLALSPAGRGKDRLSRDIVRMRLDNKPAGIATGNKLIASLSLAGGCSLKCVE